MSWLRMGLCALLAFSVLAFGAVDVWSVSILEMGAAALFLYWAVVVLRDSGATIRWSPLNWPLLGFIGIGLCQMVLHGTAYAFDLVLCAGLLHRLDSPFAAVLNLFAVTGSVAIVGGMCVPGKEPVWAVWDEGPTEDQGLWHVTLYPTENGLIKLLYRAGFPFVFRFRSMPAHPVYENSSRGRYLRNRLFAMLMQSTATDRPGVRLSKQRRILLGVSIKNGRGESGIYGAKDPGDDESLGCFTLQPQE